MKGKPVKIGYIKELGIILEFETEADAIEMMPEEPSVWERRGRMAIMKGKKAKDLEKGL